MMTRISFALLSLGLLAAAAIALIMIGRDRPVAVAAPAVATASRLPIGGLVLTSTNVELPVETAGFPDLADGPAADAVNANCTSCHSASMAMVQPRLTAAQWSETATKMRMVFKAPIAAGDDAAIVAYLAAMSAALPGAAEPAAAATAGG